VIFFLPPILLANGYCICFETLFNYIFRMLNNLSRPGPTRECFTLAACRPLMANGRLGLHSQDKIHFQFNMDYFRWIKCTVQAWVRLGFWLIPSHSNERNMIFLNTIPSQSPLFQTKKKHFPLFQQKLPFADQTRLVMNEIEWNILFNLCNHINLIQSHLYWWNINKSCSKTKEQTCEIQLNFCKIRVLMRTSKI